MQLGEKLKEARLEKGHSIEDIEKMTKIQARHLQAIEKNNFSYIPGNFYVRVFVKEYANVVDLDYRELLAEHKSELPMAENEIDYAQLRRSGKKSSSVKSSSVAKLLPTFIVIVLLFGVIFFIWRTALDPNRTNNEGSSNGNQTEQSVGDEVSVPSTNNNDDDENDSDEDDTEEPEPEDDIIEEEDELIFISYENNLSYYQFNTTDDEINLTIETSGSNWLEVENEAGERQYYATLQQSESPLTFDVSEDEHVFLRFGNPGDISISINDVDLDLSDEVSPTEVQVLWLYLNEEPELE